MASSTSSSRGSIGPAACFNAKSEAEKIRAAIKDSNRKALIDIVTGCTNAQRQKVKDEYKAVYGKNLTDELSSELKGDFKMLVLALFDRPDVLDAKELMAAMKGLGTDESTLIEILCTRSSQEIARIKAAYQQEFNQSLEEDVISDTSGNFKEILVSLLETTRDSATTVDVELAKQEGDDLYRAGVAYWGTNESVFHQIFASRSHAQLKATFQAYADLTGHDIMTALRKEMSGDHKNSLQAIAHSVLDSPGYFAEVLYYSMKGLGTNDRQLIRTLVTRSEIDLIDVKEAFLKAYDKPLAEWIKGDTKGDYRDLCLAIIGEGDA